MEGQNQRCATGSRCAEMRMIVWYGAAKEIGVGPDFESVPESVLF